MMLTTSRILVLGLAFTWVADAFLLNNPQSNVGSEQLQVIQKRRRSEHKVLPGHTKKESYSSPLPYTYTAVEDMPQSFTWGDKDGVNYLTKNLNQHIPQYCGSCWAHGASSALADRIKIARKAEGIEANLAIQFILNCGTEVAGSCYGGDQTATYDWIKNTAGFIPYDTCLGYAACSSDSSEGFCGKADWTCSKLNTCRTCSTFSEEGGFCSEVDVFPNATISEYGKVSGEHKMMAEIYRRGPIACGVAATALDEYKGGIITKGDKDIDHVISIVGWGVEKGTKFWIVRNSWGEYWGEMGYFRARKGDNTLALEEDCAWATPGSWTEINFPCYEDGSNCVKNGTYVDPSTHHFSH